jgi:hypothetical protein
MNTSPLKFPSIVLGSDRHPIHAARTALSLRYTDHKFSENQKYLNDEVSSVISNSTAIRETLDNFVKYEYIVLSYNLICIYFSPKHKKVSINFSYNRILIFFIFDRIC